MPSIANYSHHYDLGTTPPNGSTTYSTSHGNANTLTDSADGSDDNITAVGDEVIWSQSGLTVELFGVTAQGILSSSSMAERQRTKCYPTMAA